MNRCNAAHDSQCDGSCNTKCFSCGLPVWRSCSIVVPVYHTWNDKRIGVCCFRERFTNWRDLTDWMTYTHAGYEWGPMPPLLQDHGREVVLDDDAIRSMLRHLEIKDHEIAKVAKVPVDKLKDQLSGYLRFQPSVRESVTRLIRSRLLETWRDELRRMRQLLDMSGAADIDGLMDWLKDGGDTPIGTLVRDYITRR